jgi:hypothetical protein
VGLGRHLNCGVSEGVLASIAAAREALAITALLLVMVVVFGTGVLLYRRRYLGRSASDETAGFTLADVRRMYKQGQLSEEEYERMRRSIVGGVSKQAEKRVGPERSTEND